MARVVFVQTCVECDFAYDLTVATEVSALARGYADDYARILISDPARLRRRTAPTVWSPLEYSCHVRDVLLVQRERVLTARRVEIPIAEPMGRDERVEHAGYADEQPEDVSRQLWDAASLFAHALDRLSDEDWERRLVYGYPERAERTLRWVAVHTLHELRHHLGDIRRQL